MNTITTLLKRNSFLLLCIVILIGGPQDIFAQEESLMGKRNEIGFKIGYSFASVHEERFSSVSKNVIMPSATLFFSKQGLESKHEWALSYRGTAKSAGGSLLNFKVFHPEFQYSYLRKIGNQWIGAFINSSNLIVIPDSPLGGFSNNPVSYTLANSFGLKVEKNHALFNNEKHRLELQSSMQMALLSHVVRPAYAHPYPEDFLKESTFNPTREGMPSSVMSSGKIRSIKDYQSFTVKLGLGYYFNNNFKMNLSYTAQLESNTASHNSRIVSNDLHVGMAFVY